MTDWWNDKSNRDALVLAHDRYRMGLKVALADLENAELWSQSFCKRELGRMVERAREALGE